MLEVGIGGCWGHGVTAATRVACVHLLNELDYAAFVYSVNFAVLKIQVELLSVLECL